MNFVIGWWRSAVRFRGEKDTSRPLGAFYPRDEERATDEDALARSSRQAAAWPGAWWRGTQLAPDGLQCTPPSGAL